jgi:hypothetical protein
MQADISFLFDCKEIKNERKGEEERERERGREAVMCAFAIERMREKGNVKGGRVTHIR